MNDDTTQEEPLCLVAEIDDGEARGLLRNNEGHSVFAVRKGAKLHAYVNNCPHDHRPLEYMQDRFLSSDGSSIVCYAHGARFEIDTGHCTHGPCMGSTLQVIPVRIEDGVAYISSVLARNLINRS